MRPTTEQTSLFDSLSLPVMMLDRNLCFTYANAAYLQHTRKTLPELLGRYVFDAFPDTQDRVASVRGKMLETLEGRVTRLSAQPFALIHPDGTEEEVVWRATQDPVRDASGRVVGLLQRAENMTAEHDLRRREEAITNELNHRVKNMMSVVASMARITSRGADNVRDFVREFETRIMSLARTVEGLAQSDWRGLSVRDIIERELAAVSEDGAPPCTVSGPELKLSVDQTKDLSMAIHEMTTNAIKYGALRDSGGELDIRWTVADDVLTLIWSERPVDPVAAPTSTGFGTRLFDLLPTLTLDRRFDNGGMVATLVLDLAAAGTPERDGLPA